MCVRAGVDLIGAVLMGVGIGIGAGVRAGGRAGMVKHCGGCPLSSNGWLPSCRSFWGGVVDVGTEYIVVAFVVDGGV